MLERFVPNLLSALKDWDGGKWLALPSIIVLVGGIIWGILS